MLLWGETVDRGCRRRTAGKDTSANDPKLMERRRICTVRKQHVRNGDAISIDSKLGPVVQLKVERQTPLSGYNLKRLLMHSGTNA